MNNELEKQIKDGIDVSQCECYVIKHNSCNRTISGSCIKGNCQTFRLFQALKAKEQECEELKRYKSLFEKARDLWNEASRTNYKLLDKIEDLQDSLKRTICQSECYRYKEAEKLKQTLTEIKEYLKPYLFRGGVEPQWVEWQMAQREKEKMAKDIFQILQKINEVVEE